MIERSSLAGKFPRAPPRYSGNKGTDSDAFRLCSNAGEHHPGIEERHRASGEILDRDTIGHEYSVPTRCLRRLCRLDLQARFSTWNDYPVSHRLYFTLPDTSA